MSGRRIASRALAGLAILLLGCASLRERQAFDQLAATEKAPHVSGTQAYTRDDLPELNDASTLSDYLLYAALNNPGLEAAFNRWKAALEKIPQVRALPDPKLTYGYFIREVETRVGPQRQKIGVSQMFPWFGKLKLRGDVALEAANAERQRYETAKIKLFHEVKDAYYEYYYLGRAIAVTEENLRLLRSLESVAQAMYAAGRASHADTIRAQVEIGKIEDSLRGLRDLREPIVAKLNAALNRPPDAPLSWPKEIPEEPVEQSDEQILAWLKAENPELKAIDFMAAKEQAAVKLAKKNYYPDIALGLDFVDTDEAAMSGTKDSGKDPVVAMLSITLPLWYAKYRAAVREAEARYEAALKERSEKENDLTATLKLTLYKLRDAERRIDLYRNTLLPLAKESLRVTQKAFETEAADFLDLIDAERILLEFSLALERARADRCQRLAEIEMLVGKEIPRATAGPAASKP